MPISLLDEIDFDVDDFLKGLSGNPGEQET